MAASHPVAVSLLSGPTACCTIAGMSTPNVQPASGHWLDVGIAHTQRESLCIASIAMVYTITNCRVCRNWIDFYNMLRDVRSVIYFLLYVDLFEKFLNCTRTD
jgi:hypothetical protein